MIYRKAQSEIIGLVMIVIIITMAMMFYLSYATDQSDSSTKNNVRKEFIDNELSASFVQTLIRTSVVECGGLSLEDLIYDCGLEKQLIHCDGMNTCDAIFNVLEQILEGSLHEWDRSYNLTIDFGETSSILPISFPFGHVEPEDVCGRSTVGRRAPGIQIIPYHPEPKYAILELTVCAN